MPDPEVTIGLVGVLSSNNDDVQVLQELDRRDLPVVCEYAEIPDAPADSNFLLAAQRIMEDNNLGMPSEIDEALDLYISLVSIIEQVL